MPPPCRRTRAQQKQEGRRGRVRAANPVPAADDHALDAEDVGLHVGTTGQGPDVLVLTGGPGCVQYLEGDHLAPPDHRSWYPEVHAALGELAPRGTFSSVPGVPHNFWSTHLEVWAETVSNACATS